MTKQTVLTQLSGVEITKTVVADRVDWSNGPKYVNAWTVRHGPLINGKVSDDIFDLRFWETFRDEKLATRWANYLAFPVNHSRPGIWHFDSAESAYGRCQCDESVKTGDILVIHDEEIVALAGCWPIAVTKTANGLHQHTSRDQLTKHRAEDSEQFARLEESVALAKSLGFPVSPVYA